jgi:hypothetical protein
MAHRDEYNSWFYENRAFTLKELVTGPATSSISLAIHSRALASIIGHFTLAVRRHDAEKYAPPCDSCATSDFSTGPGLPGCVQFGDSYKKIEGQPCTECARRGKECSFTKTGILASFHNVRFTSDADWSLTVLPLRVQKDHLLESVNAQYDSGSDEDGGVEAIRGGRPGHGGFVATWCTNDFVEWPQAPNYTTEARHSHTTRYRADKEGAHQSLLIAEDSFQDTNSYASDVATSIPLALTTIPAGAPLAIASFVSTAANDSGLESNASCCIGTIYTCSLSSGTQVRVVV